MRRINCKSGHKAAILVVMAGLTIFAFGYTPLGAYFKPDFLQEKVGGMGYAAPVFFILIYGAGITMLLPASLFTGIGAMLFGISWGFIYNMTGAMLGASISFFIARYLGRGYVASTINERLQGYDDKLSTRGFETTLYLRLIFFPFTPLNFGMGLTGVSFRHFFWGTFWGKIASGFILTFFFATLTEVWINGHWESLLSWKTILAISLFSASFLIPGITKKLLPSMKGACSDL